MMRKTSNLCRLRSPVEDMRLRGVHNSSGRSGGSSGTRGGELVEEPT
jgi:hypothetical protein